MSVSPSSTTGAVTCPTSASRSGPEPARAPSGGWAAAGTARRQKTTAMRVSACRCAGSSRPRGPKVRRLCQQPRRAPTATPGRSSTTTRAAGPNGTSADEVEVDDSRPDVVVAAAALAGGRLLQRRAECLGAQARAPREQQRGRARDVRGGGRGAEERALEGGRADSVRAGEAGLPPAVHGGAARAEALGTAGAERGGADRQRTARVARHAERARRDGQPAADAARRVEPEALCAVERRRRVVPDHRVEDLVLLQLERCY